MSDISSGLKIKKYFLMFLNLLILILGIVIFIAGILTKTGWFAQSLSQFTGALQGFGLFAIFLGIVVFLIAFVGCFGAWKESWCLLFVYGLVILVLLIAAVVGLIVAAVNKNKVTVEIKKEMYDKLNKFGKGGEADKRFNSMQKNVKCCGVNSYQDWRNATTWVEKNDGNSTGPDRENDVPASCCKKPEQKGCGKDALSTDGEKLNAKGCYKKMEEWITSHSTMLIIAFVIFMLVLLAIVVMSCCLAGGIRRHKKYETVQ